VLALDCWPKTAASENDSGRGPPISDPGGYLASCSLSAILELAFRLERAWFMVLRACC
jgi:hypothetical protein